MRKMGEEDICSAVLVSKVNQEDSSLFDFGMKGSIFLFLLLTITATLGNSLILAALHEDSSLHPPSKLLLRSLAVTDLLVGAIAQPLLTTLVYSFLNENYELCRIFEYAAFVVTTILSGVSLFTLTAISVDRLLALLLGLRYRQVVTVKRVRGAVFIFWIISSLVGSSYVWNAKLCYILSDASAILLVLVSTYCYARIFRTIRRQQTQVQDALGGQSTGMNMARYKRTVFHTLWVHLTLAACYLPYVVVTAVTAIRGLNTSLLPAGGVTVTLVILNSSLNPVLYCWRIKEVRQAVRNLVVQFYSYFST